jgi:ubiquinone/menaquinone biosynthesis C-methylase UbiE
MNDWRSYDAIAQRYDQVWAPRFETIAAYMLALAPPIEGARLLDLGTGTGAVVAALGQRVDALGHTVGCDLSLPMLIRARARVRALRPVATDAASLPFRRASFDLVTANCVLSHIQDYSKTLREAIRVLARPGVFLASSWGPASDSYATAWTRLLESAVGEGTAQRTAEAVAPYEGHFSSPNNLRAALYDAGFHGVRIEVVELSFDLSVDEYLADREISSGGRFGRHALGEPGWRAFLERGRAELRQSFGDRITYRRPVVLGVGTPP